MFGRIGVFAVRFRWAILCGWVVVALVLTLVAPNIDDVSVSDQSSFLPSTAPSLTAHDMVTKHFPDRVSPSNAVVVVDTGDGGRVDRGEPADFVAGLTTWLNSGPQSGAPAVIDRVVSPNMGDEQTRAGLTSQDKEVALVLVRFSTVGTEPVTKEALATIESHLAETTPDGLQVHLTGDGPILASYNSETQESIDSTTWITVLLVIVILLLIYRSPVSPLIPLITISLAYLISRGVVAFLGAHAMTISAYTNVFLVVVLFGAGTDYCLFLISRFREEMGRPGTTAPGSGTTAGRGTTASGPGTTAAAARTTVRAVGETIASSAGTVIVGVAMMAFAELGLYNSTGPSIAISVAIALSAGLTFTPALLTVLGRYAFWPRRAHVIRDTGAWHAWAGKVVKRPLLAFLVPVIVLVPFAVYGGGLGRDFDLLADLPKDNETREGFDVLAEHFGAGQMQPLNVVVVEPLGADSPAGLARIGELHAKLSSLVNVDTVRSFTASLPDQETLSVADQLATVRVEVDETVAVLRRLAEQSQAPGIVAEGPWSGTPPTEELETAAAQLARVGGYLVQLGAAYPEALQNEGYLMAVEALFGLSELRDELEAGQEPGGALDPQVATNALARLDALSEGFGVLEAYFRSEKPEAILLPELYLESNEGLRALRDAYISADGSAARLQVVLESGPYSREAVETVKNIQWALSDSGYEEGYVQGNSAVLLDLQEASDRDMTRAIVFVLGGIFVVLLLLLRALVAPIYLILTILLSYAATLGVMRVVFVDILGTEGVTWWVPMFMFVMLVALGMDYNIFLMGRVKEEIAGGETREGTRHALGRTGGIITSAGIIMAGTFASMASGSILGLVQVGFAVAFGVLLDTFVVRTTLVPAIIVLLDRWSWWPRRGPTKRSALPADDSAGD